MDVQRGAKTRILRGRIYPIYVIFCISHDAYKTDVKNAYETVFYLLVLPYNRSDLGEVFLVCHTVYVCMKLDIFHLVVL